MAEKKKQIAHMVHQCFAIQNTYGKSAEALDITMDAMVMDLVGYDPDVVHEAFTRWRKTKKIIPTPACMIELCDAVSAENRRRAEPFVPAKAVERPFVPDFYEGKFWAQFEEYERQQFVEDMREMNPKLRQMFCIGYYAPIKLLDIFSLDGATD